MYLTIKSMHAISKEENVFLFAVTTKELRLDIFNLFSE